MIGAIIGAAGTLIGSAMAARQARKNQERQNRANQQLSEYTYKRDLEMWNKGNEYNAPEAQMSRLKAAGLNPMMVYGSGNAGGMTHATLPKYQKPEYSYNVPAVDVGGTIQQFQDWSIKQAQIDNLNAQRRVTEANAVIKETESQFTRIKNIYGTRKAEQMLQRGELDLDAISYKTPEMDVFPGGFGYQYRKGYTSFQTGTAAKYSRYVSELEKTNAQIALINAQRDLQNSTLKWQNWGSPAWQAIINAVGLVPRFMGR